MESIIYKNIEAERARHGLTKTAVSKEFNVTTTTYLNWIRGKTEIPASTLIEMKKKWNVTADYLLETVQD